MTAISCCEHGYAQVGCYECRQVDISKAKAEERHIILSILGTWLNNGTEQIEDIIELIRKRGTV